MLEDKINGGFGLIEIMIVLAIIVIGFMTFYPDLKKGDPTGREGCEEALRLHALIATDIQRLSEIFVMADSEDRTRKLEKFKDSKAGKVFFDEFCPTLLGCQEHVEIQENYQVPLTSLCQID